jgi:hypothetical protein
MSKSICTTIQREFDEMALDEHCSAVSFEHLTQCDECRDYHQKQTKLREIVGSLGTVSAPPDFEIRLRSRLARDNNASRTSFINSWSLSQRSVAVATLLLLLIGGAILVSQRSKRDAEPPRVAESNQAPIPASVAVPKENSTQVAVQDEHRASNIEATPTGTLINKRTLPSTPRNKRSTVAADFSSLQAPVIQGSQTVTSSDPVFPVDASQQSLKVSLLDGRGNRKTISLPTVTFGSQRVVPASTSYAPKGVW